MPRSTRSKRRVRRRGGIDVELGRAAGPAASSFALGNACGGGLGAPVAVLLVVLCCYLAFFMTSVMYAHMRHTGMRHTGLQHSLFDHFMGRLRQRRRPDEKDFSNDLPDDAGVGLVDFENEGSPDHGGGETQENGVLEDDSGAVAAPLETGADERDGWARIYDPKTQRFYYHELASNNVQWDPPAPWAIKRNGNADTVSTASNTAASTNDISNKTFSNAPATLTALPPAPRPLTALEPTDDVHLCGTDFGLSTLASKTKARFPPSTATTALWLRIIVVSHGLNQKGDQKGGPHGTAKRDPEDVLRLVRAMMMDISAASTDSYRNAVDVIVVNLAGDSQHGAGTHNPDFESARLEAERLQTKHFNSVLNFFDAGFNMVGACGQSARRDFEAALAIARAAGPAKHVLVLEPGQTLCPSAMLLLFYALRKSLDYDPDLSSLRIGVGPHGYGGLLLRDKTVQQIVERTSQTAANFFGASTGDASLDYPDDARFMTDLLRWQRAVRQDSVAIPASVSTASATAPRKSSERPIGGAFTYRFSLVANNFAGVGCGKAIEFVEDFKDLQFASDDRCRENDLSPCLASEEDAWLDYRPSHVHAVIPSSIALTIAAPGQSCTQACGALTPVARTARPYNCVPASRAGRHFSDCSTLRGRFPCPGGCIAINSASAAFPTPSAVISERITVSGAPVERGMCLMSMSGGMAPCAVASKDVSRLCPCSDQELYSGKADAVADGGDQGAADAASPPKGTAMEIVRGDLGASCETTCASKRMRCFGPSLKAVNNCEAMKKAFGCAGGCEQNEGKDQPAFEPSSNRCLTKRNEEHFDCQGRFPRTQRLCHCTA